MLDLLRSRGHPKWPGVLLSMGMEEGLCLVF